MLHPHNHRYYSVLAGAAVALAAAINVAATPSAFAFICNGSNAGGPPAATDGGGSDNTACGRGASATSQDQATTNAHKATAFGFSATAIDDSVAVGANARATVDQSTAVGRNALADHVGATAIGRNASATNDYAVALGESSTASGDRSVAVGKSAQATGNFSTAIGNSANTNGFAQSSAIGVGAQATTNNQMVFGRASETYTMPGITSDLSRSRQSGPLEVMTTDANGNLASDGGSIFNELDRLSNQDQRLRRDINQVESGVAVALSAAGPDLTGAERFGLSLNWGGFEGASAIGGGATGVIYRGQASRLAVTGGIGVGVDGENAVGGRAGGQLTW
jgi:trimeric autotransporter adhesin